jgi:oligosaccharyltransferase complex subunit beta
LKASLWHYILTISSQTGRGFKTTIESPKAEKLALFELGERAYDHLLLLPAQSKGMARGARIAKNEI